MKLTEGMKVKIRHGMITKHGTRGNYQMWCAGNIMVGEVGTIVTVPDSDMLCIEWDKEELKAPKGYDYGAGFIGSDVPEWLEIVA
jgi:hypothetical protein